MKKLESIFLMLPYFDRFSDNTVEILPFGIPCARLEGGLYTTEDFDDPDASCDIGFAKDDKLPTKRNIPITGKSNTI